MPLESTALCPCSPATPSSPTPQKNKPFGGSTWEFFSLSLCLAFREAAGAGKGSAAKAGAAGGTHGPETDS